MLYEHTVYLWDYDDERTYTRREPCETRHLYVYTKDRVDAPTLHARLFDGMLHYLMTPEGVEQDDPDDDFGWSEAFDAIPTHFWQQHGIEAVGYKARTPDTRGIQPGIAVAVPCAYAFNHSRREDGEPDTLTAEFERVRKAWMPEEGCDR